MPIQRLFARRDSRTYPHLTAEGAMAGVRTFLGQAQFHVYDIGPAQIHAEQYFQRLGLRRTIEIWVSAMNEGSLITVEISASLGDTEAAVGLIGAVVYLPLAVAVGAVSYLDYERDAASLMASLWIYLMTMEGGAPGERSEAVTRCSNCGLALDQDARYCKMCGAQVHP